MEIQIEKLIYTKDLITQQYILKMKESKVYKRGGAMGANPPWRSVNYDFQRHFAQYQYLKYGYTSLAGTKKCIYHRLITI